MQQLDTDVMDDLLSQYPDDEIFYGFDDTIDPGYLFVSVNERYEEDEED